MLSHLDFICSRNQIKSYSVISLATNRPTDSIWAYVEVVASDPNDELLYFINGQTHLHSHFVIRIHL
jgi:hypothetical protein